MEEYKQFSILARIRWFYYRKIKKYRFEICQLCGKPESFLWASYEEDGRWPWKEMVELHPEWHYICPQCFQKAVFKELKLVLFWKPTPIEASKKPWLTEHSAFKY